MSSEVPRLSSTVDVKTRPEARPPTNKHNPKAQLGRLVQYAFGTDPHIGDVVYTNQKLGSITESTLTLPILKETELREFKATAATKQAAEWAAALVATRELEACLTAIGDTRKVTRHDLKRDHDMALKKLRNLVRHAIGGKHGKGDLVYVNRRLGNITQSTLTLPALKETELSEFTTTATAETAMEAEKAACLVGIRELEASLTAMGEARSANKYDRAPSSVASPKARLAQLVSHAFGAHPSRSYIIYTHQEMDESIEGTVTLPVLKDVGPTEFKATVQLPKGKDEAEHAAAHAAFQELEPSLLAKAKARMARKEGNTS